MNLFYNFIILELFLLLFCFVSFHQELKKKKKNSTRANVCIRYHQCLKYISKTKQKTKTKLY